MAGDENELADRLRTRRTETPDSLKTRMDTARKELQHLPEFDYVVVNRNDALDDAVDAVLGIVRAEHSRVHPRKVSL